MQRRDGSKSLRQLLDFDGNHAGVDRRGGKIWPPAKSKELTSFPGGERIASGDSSCLPAPTTMPTRPKPKPAAIHPHLESVLFTEAQIKRRVRSIAQELKSTYGDGEFTIVSLINGAIMFTADLMREIDNPVRLIASAFQATERRPNPSARRRSWPASPSIFATVTCLSSTTFSTLEKP